MKFYFPDKYPKGRQCDREYMFNVANTLYEEVTTELIHHAHLQRNHVESDKKKQESVLISDHWKNELKTLPMSASVSYYINIDHWFSILEKRTYGSAAQVEVQDHTSEKAKSQVWDQADL